MSKRTAVMTIADRLSVASRVAAATLGGYALAAAAAVLMALLWPAPRAQGVLWGSMLSFTVYTVAVIWAFCTRNASRAWTGLLLGTAVCASLAWLLQSPGSAP